MRKMTREKLNYMHDEELGRTYGMLKEAVDQMRSKRRSAHSAEVEMCYVQRELEIRKARKQAHRDYLASKGKRFRKPL